MDIEVKIVSFDRIPDKILSALETIDPHHANYFWHFCAKDWHQDQVHKVYVLITEQEDEILGFFSLRVNNIIVKEQGSTVSEHIPILDIAFMDFSKNISSDLLKLIAKSFLEYIDLLAIEIAQKAGCRYIRAYLPTFPHETDNDKPGKLLIPELEQIYADMKYVYPPFREKDVIRKIKEKQSKDKDKDNVLILQYLLRDLKFT